MRTPRRGISSPSQFIYLFILFKMFKSNEKQLVSEQLRSIVFLTSSIYGICIECVTQICRNGFFDVEVGGGRGIRGGGVSVKVGEICCFLRNGKND